ncbi:unnamed protein product [Clonostachys rosea f. rosea IK726]|uniref:Uncharacterized protein n=1 Tax=Clonostachys rosea f. rosea IK726 TaxID=1349383 RepID=A0ACA9TN25_BIOOC|nr:unnamed protein product [Clonostachys rosea f. rosea IK726]
MIWICDDLVQLTVTSKAQGQVSRVIVGSWVFRITQDNLERCTLQSPKIQIMVAVASIIQAIIGQKQTER